MSQIKEITLFMRDLHVSAFEFEGIKVTFNQFYADVAEPQTRSVEDLESQLSEIFDNGIR